MFYHNLDYGIGQGSDWTNYSSVAFYDTITILENGSGFVGIQNITPTTALDVNGTIKETALTLAGARTGATNINASSTITAPTLSGNLTNVGSISGTLLSLGGGITGANITSASGTTIAGSLSVGTTRHPLATLDVQGVIASINSATWDHCRIWNDSATSYFDAGGSESRIALRNDNTAVRYPASSYPERMRITAYDTVGYDNSAPVDIGYGYMLHVGRCGGGYYNKGNLIIAQDFNSGSVRQCRSGYDDLFNMYWGDWGGTNANNTWIRPFFMVYSAPGSSVVVDSNGYVTMLFGYGTSDQRSKTGIKSVENASVLKFTRNSIY